MRSARLFALLFLTANILACGGDATLVIPQCDPCFKPLDTRDNLINNLLLSYNNRNILEFERLLDGSGAYTFHFSPTDVSQGIVLDSAWNRSQDLAATQRLLDRNALTQQAHADRIALDLIYAEGDSAWEGFTPSSHPTETWYDQAIEYLLEVKVGDTSYTQNGSVSALLTVRFTEVAGDSVWQIVEWWDDREVRPGTNASQGATRVKSSTWGSVKELFRPPEPGR